MDLLQQLQDPQVAIETIMKYGLAIVFRSRLAIESTLKFKVAIVTFDFFVYDSNKKDRQEKA